MCQSRDFPTELYCNTIIHLLFHYFLLPNPYFIFNLTIFYNTGFFSFFGCGTASYNVTCISSLVLSTSVGMGKEDTITYKHLAHLLSEKWSSPYSVVMGRLSCNLGFSLLRSSVTCVSGDRILHPSVTVFLQLSTLLLLRGICLL